jgi:hypothetical protein
VRYRCTAEVCSADGPFDAAHSFGDGGEKVGTAEEIGAAIRDFLPLVSRADMRDMEYGTGHFSFRFEDAHVLVVGTFQAGFQLHGPFPTFEDAEQASAPFHGFVLPLPLRRPEG